MGPIRLEGPEGRGPGHRGIVSAVKMAKEEWLIMQLHPVPLTGSEFEFLTQQMFAGPLHGVGTVMLI